MFSFFCVLSGFPFCLDLTENGAVWFLCSSPLCESSAFNSWLNASTQSYPFPIEFVSFRLDSGVVGATCSLFIFDLLMSLCVHSFIFASCNRSLRSLFYSLACFPPLCVVLFCVFFFRALYLLDPPSFLSSLPSFDCS